MRQDVCTTQAYAYEHCCRFGGCFVDRQDLHQIDCTTDCPYISMISIWGMMACPLHRLLPALDRWLHHQVARDCCQHWVVDHTIVLQEVAARRLAWGAFFNSGQTCVRPDYVLCDAKVYGKFSQCLKKEIATQWGEFPPWLRKCVHADHVLCDDKFDDMFAECLKKDITSMRGDPPFSSNARRPSLVILVRDLVQGKIDSCPLVQPHRKHKFLHNACPWYLSTM